MSHSSEGEREGGCWDSNVSHSNEGGRGGWACLTPVRRERGVSGSHSSEGGEVDVGVLRGSVSHSVEG